MAIKINRSGQSFAASRKSFGRKATGRSSSSALRVGYGVLGYSDAISIGGALIDAVKKQSDIDAEHGTAKTYFLDGLPVSEADRQLSVREIRAARRNRSGREVS